MINCGFCGEPILAHERPSRWATDPLHAECSVRLIVGSVAHLEKRCSCYVAGSHDDDPRDMTKREAARLAVAVWTAQREKEWNS